MRYSVKYDPEFSVFFTAGNFLRVGIFFISNFNKNYLDEDT